LAEEEKTIVDFYFFQHIIQCDDIQVLVSLIKCMTPATMPTLKERAFVLEH
jgi:hypothetical protein